MGDSHKKTYRRRNNLEQSFETFENGVSKKGGKHFYFTVLWKKRISNFSMEEHRTTDYAMIIPVGIVCVLLSDFVLLLGLVVWFPIFTTDNVGVNYNSCYLKHNQQQLHRNYAKYAQKLRKQNILVYSTYWLCEVPDVTIQCLLTLTLYLFYISTLPYPTAIIYLHFCTSAGSIVSFQKFKTGLSTNFSNVP